MRLLPGLAAVVLVTACGASSTGSLAQPSPAQTLPDNRVSPAPTAATPVPSTKPPAPLPTRSERAPSPSPIGVVSATAGTGSTGPGRVTSPAASPSPRPSPSAVAGTVTVTDDDAGTTVHLTAGQRLRVRLTKSTYDPPESSADRVVVRRSSSGGYPSDQPVDATFEGVAKGSADVTAMSDAACFHTEPRCMMAQREWRVTVVVG